MRRLRPRRLRRRAGLRRDAGARLSSAGAGATACSSGTRPPTCGCSIRRRRSSQRDGLVWIGNWGDGERSERTGRVPAAARARRRPAARYPRRALPRRRRCATLARYGARYRGWLANAARAGGVRAPPRDRARAAPLLRRDAARHSDHPRVRGAGLRHPAGLARPGTTRGPVPAGPGLPDGPRRRARWPRHLARCQRRSRICAQRWSRSGLETIRARHTCAHRVDELLAIVAAARSAEPDGERRMKIAFYGSSLLSSYWNGAATYYRGLLRDSPARGYDITFYEPDAFDRQQHRDIEPPAWAKVRGLSGDRGRRCARCSPKRRAADVVVKASGVGVFDDALLDGVIAAARPGGACASSGTSMRRRRSPSCGAAPDHPLRRALPSLDLVLTYGGGPPVVAAYEGFGARALRADLQRARSRRRIIRCRPSRASRPISPSSATGCRTARRGSKQFFLEPGRAAARAALPDRRQRLGRQGDAAERAAPRPCLHARAQRLQRHAARGAQRRPRQHGDDRLFAGDARVRGGRRRRLPDHRRLGRASSCSSSPDEEVLVARDGAGCRGACSRR